MGYPNQLTQIYAAFKSEVMRRSHSDGLKLWWNEAWKKVTQLSPQDIRLKNVPHAWDSSESDNFVTAYPTLLQKHTLLQLTELPGTNGHLFAAYQTPNDLTSNRIVNWIDPHNDGRGWYPRIYKDVLGTQEIPTNWGDLGWWFDYYNGCIVSGGDGLNGSFTAGGINTVYATFYQYIGPDLTALINATVDISFEAKDWQGQNELYVIATGVPGNQEIGPHNLFIGGSYDVSIYTNLGSGWELKRVELDIHINRIDGKITLRKAPKTPAFGGRVFLTCAV